MSQIDETQIIVKIWMLNGQAAQGCGRSEPHFVSRMLGVYS